MPRSFRFDPPEPRLDLLTRPRLLGALLGRWDHRVTLVVGGPGLGKTTLLTQAVVENRLAPRGDDCWIGVEPHDADGDSLAWAVLDAFPSSEHDTVAPNPVHVGELIWQRTPHQVCLVLDDVHLLSPGSEGAAWLGALVDSLPANGHLLLASRSEPAMPLARLEGSGGLLRLGEDDLRLSPAEVEAFAEEHGTTAEHLADSGGWPAMAELATSSERTRTGAYLWEEVLEPLGDERRRILAIVCDIGGADDRLASAAAGAPVELGRVLAGVPLVAAGSDGWHVPHALWRTAPGIGLAADDRADVRRRAVHDLTRRGLVDQAFALVEEAGLWDVAPAVLRSACLESERLNPRQLARCLALCPTSVRATPPGRLAAALRLAFTQPAAAVEPLRLAAVGCREAGDVEGELTALAQLGRLAWGRQDHESITGDVVTRFAALEATGNPTARALAAFVRAMAADLVGDDNRMLAEIDSVEPGVLDPVWETMTTWLHGGVLLDRGHADTVLEMLDAAPVTDDPAVATILGGLRVRTLWALGRLEDAFDVLPDTMDALRAAGIASLHAQGLTNAAIAYAHVGDVAKARLCLDEAAATSTEPIGGLSARTAVAEASILLCAGRVDEASTLLSEAYDRNGGWTHSADRRMWRHMLALSYVLVPQSRDDWDRAPLLGHLKTSRELAAAVVAARQGKATDRLWRLDVADLAKVRSALHLRFAADLAVGLAAIGRPEGAALLEALGPSGRAMVQDMTTTERGPRGKQGRALLAAVPAPPPVVSHLDVLGPLRLWRDDESSGERREVLDPDLRRARARALLGYLVSHRRTHRAAIGAALWPDLDDKALSNNLGVTLSYVLRALEPWRAAGEAPYLVRLDGQSVELVAGDWLQVDVDLFDRHLAAAERAEAEGTPSVALDHHLAAAALYRGDLLGDVPEAEWIDLDRAHYRSRFVATAIRAGQLLVGHGENEQAEAIAQRALSADPWNEDAYGVLATAALARANRSAAREAITRCMAALVDLGAEPSEATRHLMRRCGLAAAAPAQERVS